MDSASLARPVTKGTQIIMISEMGFYPDKGYVLHGTVEEAIPWCKDMHIIPTVSIADPPYGDITSEEWDKADINAWIQIIKEHEEWRCPIYWWGGIGKQNHRPFFEFILRVENETHYRMRDLITWKKKRGYGKKKDYLFVREECAFLTFHGNEVNTWNTPYLTEKRGYPGFNAKYPAKSEYYRRTNVWDETEILRNKLHPTQKASIVCQIPIDVHSNPKEVVLDLYSGSGETSVQALKLGRAFIAIERKKEYAINICGRIEEILKHSTE